MGSLELALKSDHFEYSEIFGSDQFIGLGSYPTSSDLEQGSGLEDRRRKQFVVPM